jgi:DNA-binding LacI/PurR family transcriptional regulator
MKIAPEVSHVSFPRRPATLKDVAQSLGLDISTVSKVLSGGDISVRPETREAIMEAARRLNYRPHAQARTLRTQRTGALGVLLPNIMNPVYASIVRGAVRRADEKGYVMLVADVEDEAASTSTYLKLVGERRIDGVIIAVSAEAELMSAILHHPLPHVFVNRRAKGGRSVTVDDYGAGLLAARTLAEAGHRRLGFIGAPDDLDTAQRRRSGFAAGCAAAGLPGFLDARFPYSRSGGFEALGWLLSQGEPPTAIFASNTLVGMGAVAAAYRRGVIVPDELSILTLEAEETAYATPPLTAIALPLGEMGARAVDELDRALSGEEPQDIVVEQPPELILRQSLAPLPHTS